jgi:hypothetical protein
MTLDQARYAGRYLCGDTTPYRTFPDGTAVWICPMFYGKGRLCIGPADAIGYEQGFCYERIEDAFAAADRWDGVGEPDGWIRCIRTGRRRPGGDATKEYILK